MLAGIRNYLYVWQLPLFVLLAAGWLWWGGRLLLKSLRKRRYPKPVSLGRCVLICFLGGLGGGATAMVVFFLFESIGGGSTAMRIAGGIAGISVLLVVACLVIYAMLDLSVASAFKTGALPVLAQVFLLAIIGAGAGIPAGIARHRDLRRDTCRQHLRHLALALHDSQRRNGTPAPDLKVLAEIPTLNLTCPGAAEKQIAYFYHPSRVLRTNDTTERILACDYRGNHPGGRNVLLANLQCRWYDSDDFQQLLAQECNGPFAAALRAAEGD